MALQTPREPVLPMVLVVDDERCVLELIARILRGSFEVHGFDSPSAALEAAPSLQPRVVITDFRMPGMNGLELVRRLRELPLSFNALLITGFADMGEVATAQNHGWVDRVLGKPFRSAELRAELTLTLGAKKALNPS